MNYQQVMDKWNAAADSYNQWDCLSEEEKVEFALVTAAAAAAVASNLEDIEQYRLQMAAISTAAIGYWKESDGIQPDYDTPALRDVAKLYAKYDQLYRAAAAKSAIPTEQVKAWDSEARATAAAIPAGYRLVPEVPTRKMISAAHGATMNDGNGFILSADALESISVIGC